MLIEGGVEVVVVVVESFSVIDPGIVELNFEDKLMIYKGSIYIRMDEHMNI